MLEVLIVDDDFMVARAHERIIERMDAFRVIGTASNGEEALELIRTRRPHLVLLDIYLPDMSGVDVIRRIREKGENLDFLVLSAAREVETVTAALQGGVVSYLLKPFKIAELESRLATYVERRRLLERGPDLDQRDLDHALGAVSRLTAELPKGFSRETCTLVETALRDAADLAASECAELLGVSRVVARKYLEYLVMKGDATVALRYGHAGRPQRRYSAR